jgi:gliding motility-associated-like protein
VQVGTPAVAGFTYTQDPCLPELSFSNISTFSDSYRWQFSNNPADTLRTNSMAPFTRVFAGPGIYPIKVVANPDSACPDSITQTIEVFALPQPAFEVISDSCTLTLVLENRSTRPRAGDVYRWQFGPIPADTLRTLTLDPVSHTFPVLGTYPVTLVINPQGNCPQTLTREVAVAPRPTGDFSWARLACTRTWRFTANMPLANHFTWYLNGQQVGTGPTLDLDFPQGGNYSMRLRGSSLPTACYHEAILTVPIAVPVNAQIGASVPECSDELLLQSTGSGQVVSWLWEVDGVAYSTSELRITFIPNSTLPIRLLLEDVDGCTYMADTLLRLGPGKLALLRVPNIFSPNNDGVNDLWQPETNNPDCLERLQIFNRWGVQVFETPQPALGWDGRDQNSKAAPEGVYVFILRLRDGNERSGTVTLVR